MQAILPTSSNSSLSEEPRKTQLLKALTPTQSEDELTNRVKSAVRFIESSWASNPRRRHFASSSPWLATKMESMMEKRIDHLMAQPGVVGVCVSDANGLPLSARGSLNTDVAPLASQLITLCSQIEPMNPVVPQITLTGDHGKVTLSKHEDLIMALHQKH